MDYIKYISLLIPPFIALVLFLYLRPRMPRQASSLMIKSFLWGMLSIIFVIIVQIASSYFDFDNLKNLRRIIFYSLVIAAFFSELGKYIFLRFYCYPRELFKGPIEGIIFSVMIAMGFATLNNILYFINIGHLEVNTMNAVTAGPANVIFGVLMGFFIGLGKYRKMRFIDSMTGLLAAVFFHALYSFCLLTDDYKLLSAFFIGSAIIITSLIVVGMRINNDIHREEKK